MAEVLLTSGPPDDVAFTVTRGGDTVPAPTPLLFDGAVFLPARSFVFCI